MAHDGNGHSMGQYEEEWGICHNDGYEHSFYEEQRKIAADMEPSRVVITCETSWFSRDGTPTPINKMRDSHLLNTINVLKGLSPLGTTYSCDEVTRRKWLNAMCNEAYRRGLKL